MGNSLNWQKANIAKRIRDRGHEYVDDGHFDPQPKINSASIKNPKKTGRLSSPNTHAKNPKSFKFAAPVQNGSREQYLKAVVFAYVHGLPPPKPKPILPKKIRDQIGKFPSRLDWAKAQREFSNLANRFKLAVPLTLQESVTKKVSVSISEKKSIKRPSEEIKAIKSLRKEIRSAKATIREAKKKLRLLGTK